MDYPWYEIINYSDSLEQGDLIADCPIVTPPENIIAGENIKAEIILIDAIILSQSCDLENSKIEYVLVCPYYSLNVFKDNLPEAQFNSDKAKDKFITNISKGYVHNYHLLNNEEGKVDEILIVDFSNVFGIQINAIKSIASKFDKRIRLLPPYKEHLSQAFARYFMRVGLPQNISI